MCVFKKVEYTFMLKLFLKYLMPNLKIPGKIEEKIFVETTYLHCGRECEC